MDEDIKISFSICLPKDLYDAITTQMKKQDRSRNKQIIYWLKLARLLEANPDIKTSLLLRDQLL